MDYSSRCPNGDAARRPHCYRNRMNRGPIVNEIYVGAPVDQASERKFLASTVQWLVEQQTSFVVLANLHVGGRQIDCIVATEQGVSVVEVKSSYLPVRGDLNGIWERLHASGEWRSYTNAYRQALDAKNALRDAMMAAKPVGKFYPAGYAVFTSGFAEGSKVPDGDFKVEITTLDKFLSSRKLQRAAPWSLDDWKAFAAKLRLIPISIDDAISSSKDREITELLGRYSVAVMTEYGSDAARWLPEDSEQQSSLLTAATTGTGCFITGTSGCGKTLMAKWIAVKLASTGNPTFFFAAKNFTGSWADFIRREVALLFDESPSALLQAISRVDRPLVLVLDGINEFGAHSSNALRGIRALARRFGAKLILTAQGRKLPEFDGLRTVTVNRPSIDLKRRIAQSGGATLNRTALEVLKAVSSGIEAKIIGQIGADFNADATRLVLLDQYIRIRLGRHARAASFGLRRLAGSFHGLVAFSISEASFDEFMREQAVHFEDCDAMFNAGLLVRRVGRVSFSHEMIQNACAAYDLARKAAIDAATFGPRLSTPVLEAIAGDVISAIEDVSVCRAVLEEVTSSTLLSAAADGELGTIAGSGARALLDKTADECVAEIRVARLALVLENEALRVEWVIDCPRTWTEAAQARLSAIGHRAVSGTELDAYFGLCAEMDERLASECQRLAEAARDAKFPLRSRSFELAYYGFSGEIGFTNAARSSHPGLYKPTDGLEMREFDLKAMSSGQLLFFLENRSSFLKDGDRGGFAEGLIYLLRERFRWEPYHVQLAILHAVSFARQVPEETLGRLIEAINALDVSPTNWAINSSIIDALKILGALDDQGEDAREQIKCELASILGEDEGTVDKNLALSLCLRMFDHPFDSIYVEEILELDDGARHQLYRRALGASELKNSFGSSWLVRQVASFEDEADVALLSPLTTLPDSSSPFPQEEWGRFVSATRFLGRHNAELPRIDGEAFADCCLTDIRTLLYAAESRRQPDAEAARLAWRRLHAMPAQLVVGCLGEVCAALTEQHWGEEEQIYAKLNLAEVYPADCLKIARQFIKDDVEAQYFSRVPMREMGPSFAFDTVGRYGDRSDIDCLRALSRAHRFARYALIALRSLDSISASGF